MKQLAFAIAGLLLLLIVALAGAAYWFFNGDGVRIALERQASTWLGQPVRITAAQAQLFPRLGVRLEGVTVGDPVSVTLAQVQVSTGLRALLSRRIEGAELLVSNSRVEMPLPFAVPPTAPGTGAAPPAPDGGGVSVASVRAIRLQNIVVASRGREVTMSADSSLEGSRLAIASVTASSRGTQVTAQGTVQLAPTLDADLTATANTLDVDDLLALASAFAPASTPVTTPAADAPPAAAIGRVVAHVTAATAVAGGTEVKQFASTVRMQGQRISLSPTTFLLFGGRYQGDLDIDLRDATQISLTSRITDIDVAQLAAFGGAADTISGKLSGNGTFTGRGQDFAAMLASARGNGNATIANGSIRRLNLLRTVVLFFGRPAPGAEAASDAFERIDARFSLAGQVITADALSLRSRDADVVGEGTLALENKGLRGRADLSLSEQLSKQAGTDLYRYTREGNRIVLPATIGGTLQGPQVTIDAGAAVQRGLRNELQRRMQGVLERFTRPK